jgi:hypothetical protein
MRVTFETASTTLTPGDLAAIKRFAAAGTGNDIITFDVVAHATGKADDPSVARRLSLSRALAVRAALTAEGIASSRIYVRALGAQGGDGPPDRADIRMLGANAPTDATAGPTAGPTAGATAGR